VAAVSGIGDDAIERVADDRLHGRDDGGERDRNSLVGDTSLRFGNYLFPSAYGEAGYFTNPRVERRIDGERAGSSPARGTTSPFAFVRSRSPKCI
jgi:hypothetical protein